MAPAPRENKWPWPDGNETGEKGLELGELPLAGCTAMLQLRGGSAAAREGDGVLELARCEEAGY